MFDISCTVNGFCRVMRCISAAYVGMRCLSVCPSVRSSRSWIVPKRTKIFSKFFSPSGSQAILVFHAKRNGDITTITPPPNGASNAGGVGKKRDSGRISGFAAYKSTVLSIVRVAKCEKQSRDERRQASSRALTAASVVRCSHKTTTKCLWRARRYTPETEVNPPPDTTPLVITPFCCHRTS